MSTAQEITAADIRLQGELVLSDQAIANLARWLVDAAIAENENRKGGE
jgi:hypothetical protein